MGELNTTWNLNERALRVADELARSAGELGATIHNIAGARVIDTGSKSVGSVEAGVLLSRVCLSDLATVQIVPTDVAGLALPGVAVNVRQPVAACMASQYAGWQISVGKFFAMGSGPMRAAYGKEELFDHIGHREKPTVAVGVLETGKIPDEAVIKLISEKTGVAPEALTLIIARTASLAGSVQVVARSVETALHKLHALHFDLSRIVGGFGIAPLSPVAKDDLAGIGRTNDAVLYGSTVTLLVTGDDDSLAQIVPKLPSCASTDFGQPFIEIFKRYNHDFYKIDPLLFSPAVVCVQNITTGSVHHAGALQPDVLASSFGLHRVRSEAR
jgi:methenyltetrahydromethanopterin cyclohydrolase